MSAKIANMLPFSLCHLSINLVVVSYKSLASVLAFYFDDPNSNPAEVYSFYSENLCEMVKKEKWSSKKDSPPEKNKHKCL